MKILYILQFIILAILFSSFSQDYKKEQSLLNNNSEFKLTVLPDSIPIIENPLNDYFQKYMKINEHHVSFNERESINNKQNYSILLKSEFYPLTVYVFQL